MPSELINTSTRQLSLRLPSGAATVNANASIPLFGEDVERAKILTAGIKGVDVIDVANPVSEKEAVRIAEERMVNATNTLAGARATFAGAQKDLEEATVAEDAATTNLKKARTAYTVAGKRREKDLQKALREAATRSVEEKQQALEASKELLSSI